MPVNDVELTNAITQRWGGGDDAVAKTSKRSLTYQYWRKCRRENCSKHLARDVGRNVESGWITVGPSMSDPLQHADYINIKHMEPLPQYGVMTIGERDAVMTGNGRYEQILLRGGIHEFPAEQIIAYNWDMIPAVREARPDAVGERIWCDHCVRRGFTSPDAKASHDKVVHADLAATKGLSAAVREIAGVTGGQQQGNQQEMAAMIAAGIFQALAAMQQGGTMNFGLPLANVQPVDPEKPPYTVTYEEAEASVAEAAVAFEEAFATETEPESTARRGVRNYSAQQKPLR